MPKIEHTPDAKIKVSLENGPEVFTANDPLEATNQLAKALDDGKKWGKEGWDKARQYEAEIATLKATPPTPVAPVDTNAAQLQKYLADETAKGLGFKNGDEFKETLAKAQGTVSEVAKANALQTFFTSHPEFPGTPEANDMIGKIFDEKGWTDMTADNLHFAHLEAIHRHQKDPKQGYEPLSAEAINAAWANNMAAASRQTPPPMLRTGNPETTVSGQDVYKMPLNDLRAAAIKQELERK